MRLVWIIIPLVLFSIIGVPELFADEFTTYQITDEDDILIKITDENQVLRIEKILDSASLEISIKAISDGNITIKMSHDLIGIGWAPGCYEDDFLVLVDGEESFPINDEFTVYDRIITIPFRQDDSKIEIIPSFVPESWMYFDKCVSKQQSSSVTEQQIEVSPPPLKQIANGVHPDNVTCTEGLELIFKSTTNHPACVKPTTAEKLIERGWGTSEKEETNRCMLEPDPGLCRAAFQKYYFDQTTNSCKFFIWGGCEGVIPFETREECQMQCEPTQIISKQTWLEKHPIQCLGNPWEKDWLQENDDNYEVYYQKDLDQQYQVIKNYYEKYELKIQEVKIVQTYLTTCLACSCEADYALYISVDEDDISQAEIFGFTISHEPFKPVWFEKSSVQCEDLRNVSDLKNRFLEIWYYTIDFKTVENTYQDARCEACGCLGWDTHYVLIPNHTSQMAELFGWELSRGP